MCIRNFTLIQWNHYHLSKRPLLQLLWVWWMCRWWCSDAVVTPLTSCSLSLLARSAAGSVRLSGALRRLSMLSSSLARSSSSFSSCWASEATFGSSAGDATGAGGSMRCYHPFRLSQVDQANDYFCSGPLLPLTCFLWLGGFCFAVLQRRLQRSSLPLDVCQFIS